MNDNPTILVKFPSRSRPEKLFRTLDDYRKLHTHDNFKILLTLDLDDPTATNEEFKERLLNYPEVFPIWGTSDCKVSAINRDICFFDNYDILIVLSDDMHLQPGFDAEIIKAFQDGFSGLVHFNDGIANERLCTFPVMDRAYYNLFGFIYDPIYTSVCCDNHQMELAILLGKYKYIPVKVVQHIHPAYKMAPMDDLYRRNEDPVLYQSDTLIYREQKANQFFYQKYLKHAPSH